MRILSPVSEMRKGKKYWGRVQFQNSPRFHPGNRAEVFIWQNFKTAYRDPDWKNRDLGSRASPPSPINTQKNFYKRFRGKARSRKPGSYEVALIIYASTKRKFRTFTCMAPIGPALEYWSFSHCTIMGQVTDCPS